MEHAIGEIVTLPNGRKAKVVEVDIIYCHHCLFFRHCVELKILGLIGNCNPLTRTDHKHIVYKEIKEE